VGLHVGLLGTGGWAAAHLKALASSRHVAQVTLVGRNRQALRTLASEHPIVTRTVTDRRAVLTDQSVEVLIVVLPHHLHVVRSVEALVAGKHVICEKPAATNLAGFDRVVRQAEQVGRRFLVVMNHLYQPAMIHARKLISSGAIGRPFLSVENAYSDKRRTYRDFLDWRTTRRRAGGGVLIDGGFHMVYRHLDLLADFGEPRWVTADCGQLGVTADGGLRADRGEDYVVISVGFEGPLRISWSHAWTLATPIDRPRQSFVAGTDGTLEWTDSRDHPLVLHRTQEKPLPGDVSLRVLSSEASLALCLEDYIDAIVCGRAVCQGSLELARLTLAVVLSAYRSGRSGRRVKIS
jgi:predicted dehydrogenase